MGATQAMSFRLGLAVPLVSTLIAPVAWLLRRGVPVQIPPKSDDRPNLSVQADFVSALQWYHSGNGVAALTKRLTSVR